MIRVLVVGLGTMGRSHALAHHRHPGAEIVGLVNHSPVGLPEPLRAYPRLRSFEDGLALRPGLVVIATHPDSHADPAIQAMEAGAHVFVEKPLAPRWPAPSRSSRWRGRRAASSWWVTSCGTSLPGAASSRRRALGGPIAFRMNLNQQSSGPAWEAHKALMRSASLIVDCGVHYVDVMCQITDARSVRVYGMGLPPSDEAALEMYNHGQFQVAFADGSVGWYEAGWG